MKKRVRFAPSPTGLFHVGSARIALANYLFARKNKGVFVLRIEDTDKERSKKEYEENIIDCLQWLGIEFDEGLGRGDYGPYRQSERSYDKYIKELIDKGKAYYCFCSKEELDSIREKQEEAGETPRYPGTCRDLSSEKAEEKIKSGSDYVIRMRVGDKKVSFRDRVRGLIEFDGSLIEDFVIAKDEERPLYNLACVIDDHEMKVTDVIRGEDHISNTPKQILIAEALDFKRVNYAHLPLILAPDKSKLSKRFGAVSVSEYRKEGFLPEALVNFLALLGWSPGDDREFFTMEELIDEFSLERCKKAGAVFNKKKLEHINTLHLKEATGERLALLSIPFWIEAGYINPVYEEDQYPPAMGAKGIKTGYRTEDGRKYGFDALKEIAEEHKDRISKVAEIVDHTGYFFKQPKADFDLLQWKEMTSEELGDVIDKSIEVIDNIKNWEKEEVKDKLLQKANQFEDRGRFLWPLRAALTGEKASAGPLEVTYILGREEAIGRLKKAKDNL